MDRFQFQKQRFLDPFFFHLLEILWAFVFQSFLLRSSLLAPKKTNGVFILFPFPYASNKVQSLSFVHFIS
ncbi:hypothetical protein H5410_000993 [Solanum commersonii]|uniref:Uncharacterized protein n=1 Tax=Solanum commersonii TaxID=4109 RepID=A0A9J6AXU4_SOLCO|nr:hypothetical protein H5410_000993 [Solanum commersonii]